MFEMELLIATLGLRRLLAMVGVFGALLLACVLLGIFAAPSALLIDTAVLGRTEPWESSVSVSPLNQALFAYLVVETQRMQLTASKKLPARVLLRGRVSEDEAWQTLADRSTELALVCEEGAEECDSVRLARVPFVEYAEYKVQVLPAPGALPEWATAARIEFEMIEARFTLFEMWARVALLVLTLVVGGAFVYSCASCFVFVS